MKYSVSDNDGDTITLEMQDDDVLIEMEEGGTSRRLLMTKDQFKQLRRAIGYVWTELEGKAE